jgi:6,7-dimethyl-8-ribityllumazine synthase
MKHIKIGIVRSTYYDDIGISMFAGAMSVIDLHNDKNKFFKDNPIKYTNIQTLGSFEIPQLISKHIDECDAFIALGCIIKGKTPHFDFISKSITDALMKISIENKKPIGNGVLTCLNKKQAYERSVGKKNKGTETAKAVIHSLLMSIIMKNPDLCDESGSISEFTDPDIYHED